MSDFWFGFNMIGLFLFGFVPWGVFFGFPGLGVQVLAVCIFIPILAKYEGF